MTKVRIIAGAAVAALGLTLAMPATAAGCNGVVSILQWGCAPWDNNNGPQYPYYKKKLVKAARNAPTKVENGQAFVWVNGQWAPLVAAGGGNVVPTNAGNLVAAGGGNAWVPQ